MLMKSMPDTARQEMVASRGMTTVNILFRLMVLFQPMGLRERTILLTFSTIPVLQSHPLGRGRRVYAQEVA